MERKKSDVIVLIGVSGAGKTHWATQLEQRGFFRTSCGDMLAEDLKRNLGEEGVSEDAAGIAQWMGLPHEERSPDRQMEYSSTEEMAMMGALAAMAQATQPRVVIDTTETFVHVQPMPLFDLMKNVMTFVYLEKDPAADAKTLQTFIENPRPTIWEGFYNPLPNETHSETIARCYPLLLAERRERYRALADLTIPSKQYHHPAFTVDHLLQRVAKLC